jgi:hypothetical protein
MPMRGIEILTAQFDVPENMVVSVEDDTTAKGVEGDPEGVFLTYGVETATGDLCLFLPDETAERTLLALLASTPRLSSRALDHAQSILKERVEANAGKTRAELDPGPLPLPQGCEQ